MKRFFLLAALCALPLAGWSQPAFQPTGKSVADLVQVQDEDVTIVTAEGDINKDGVKDAVIALRGYYVGDDFAFYFGDKDGGYRLFRSYDTSMYGQQTGITVTDAGVVRIQCDGDAGSDIFLFRWEGGDFRLIGGKEDRHKSEADYDISYNYLTGKMIRTDGTGKGRKSTTEQMPAQPKIHFGWIPLHYDALTYLIEAPEDGDPLSPEDMLVMGIFRVMQANDMVFWHFADWENPYHNPIPEEDDQWYASDEYMSPGSYNAWSSLYFERISLDGAYQIDLTESFYDRSYESQFNEDLSNVDEVMEEYETPEEITHSRWIFRDGQFFPQEVPEEATQEGDEVQTPVAG